MAVRSSVACWAVNYLKMHFFLSFFLSIYFIEYPLVLWDNENRSSWFLPALYHSLSYILSSCLLSERKFFTLLNLFLWELLSAFDHCLGSLPSLCSPTIFHFSVKVTYAARSILSKVMPLITIYMYLILLPDLFLMESSMLGFIFGCCYILSMGLHQLWRLYSLFEVSLVHGFIFTSVLNFFGHRFVHSCNRSHTEVTHKSPFSQIYFW